MSFILYNAPQSTCSQRVRFVLNAKQLPFEEKKLDLLAGDQLAPERERLGDGRPDALRRRDRKSVV